MHRFSDPAGPAGGSHSAASGVAFRQCEDVGTLDISISRLNSQPACTPVNASLRPRGSPTHDSGPS